MAVVKTTGEEARLIALTNILEAFDYRAWDISTPEQVLCLSSLETLGVALCPMHIPQPIGGVLEPDVASFGIPCAYGGSTREGARNGNSVRMFVPGWAYWLLTEREPWPFQHLQSSFPLITHAGLDRLRKPLMAALRLGGPNGVNDLLRLHKLCVCPIDASKGL